MKTNSTLLKKISKALVMVLIGFLASASLHAQVVTELQGSIDLMKSSSDAAIKAQAAVLENLVYDLQSTVKIREGSVVATGDAPYVRVDADVQSISKLGEENPLFAQAELLTIRINSLDDLKLVLDPAALKAFSSLKFVRFLCLVECTPEQAGQLIKASDTKLLFFYFVSIPS
jgi:hypothetical protein